MSTESEASKKPGAQTNEMERDSRSLKSRWDMKKKKASGEPSNIQSSAGNVFHTSAAEEKAKNVAGYLQQVNLHFISRSKPTMSSCQDQSKAAAKFFQEAAANQSRKKTAAVPTSIQSNSPVSTSQQSETKTENDIIMPRTEDRFQSKDQAVLNMTATPNSLTKRLDTNKDKHDGMTNPLVEKTAFNARILVWELYHTYFSLVPVHNVQENCSVSSFLIPTLYRLITYQENPQLAAKFKCTMCKNDVDDRLFKVHLIHLETRQHFLKAAETLKSLPLSSLKRLKHIMTSEKKEGLCEICPDSDFSSWTDHILHSTQHRERKEMFLQLYMDVRLAKKSEHYTSAMDLMDYVTASNDMFKRSFTWFVRSALETVPLAKPFRCTLCRREFKEGVQYLEHVDTDHHMKELFLFIRYRMTTNKTLFWKQINFTPYFPYQYFCEICPIRKPVDTAQFDPGSIDKHCSSKEHILNKTILMSIHRTRKSCPASCSCCRHKYPRIEMSISPQPSLVYTPSTEEHPRCNIYSVTYEPENEGKAVVQPSPPRPRKCKMDFATAVRKGLTSSATSALTTVTAVTTVITKPALLGVSTTPLSSPSVSSTTAMPVSKGSSVRVKTEPKDRLDSLSVSNTSTSIIVKPAPVRVLVPDSQPAPSVQPVMQPNPEPAAEEDDDVIILSVTKPKQRKGQTKLLTPKKEPSDNFTQSTAVKDVLNPTAGSGDAPAPPAAKVPQPIKVASKQKFTKIVRNFGLSFLMASLQDEGPPKSPPSQAEPEDRTCVVPPPLLLKLTTPAASSASSQDIKSAASSMGLSLHAHNFSSPTVESSSAPVKPSSIDVKSVTNSAAKNTKPAVQSSTPVESSSLAVKSVTNSAAKNTKPAVQSSTLVESSSIAVKSVPNSVAKNTRPAVKSATPVEYSSIAVKSVPNSVAKNTRPAVKSATPVESSSIAVKSVPNSVAKNTRPAVKSATPVEYSSIAVKSVPNSAIIYTTPVVQASLTVNAASAASSAAAATRIGAEVSSVPTPKTPATNSCHNQHTLSSGPLTGVKRGSDRQTAQPQLDKLKRLDSLYSKTSKTANLSPSAVQNILKKVKAASSNTKEKSNFAGRITKSKSRESVDSPLERPRSRQSTKSPSDSSMKKKKSKREDKSNTDLSVVSSISSSSSSTSHVSVAPKSKHSALKATGNISPVVSPQISPYFNKLKGVSRPVISSTKKHGSLSSTSPSRPHRTSRLSRTDLSSKRKASSKSQEKERSSDKKKEKRRSKSPAKRRSKSRSKSPVNRRRSKSRSKSPSRRRRSKSRSKSPSKRKRSKSRSKSPSRRRRSKSRSKSPSKRRRSKSRSKSPSRKIRSRSNSPSRRKQSKSRSKSPSRRRRSKSRSRSPSKRRRSKSRSISPSKRRQSKSRSRSHGKEPGNHVQRKSSHKSSTYSSKLSRKKSNRSRSRSKPRYRSRSGSRSRDRKSRKRHRSRSRSRSYSRDRNSRRRRSYSSSSSSRSSSRSRSPSPERQAVLQARHISPPLLPIDARAYNAFSVVGREPRLQLRPLSPVTKTTVSSVLDNAWSCYYSRFYSVPQPSMLYVLESQIAFLKAYEGFFTFPPKFENYYCSLVKPEDLKEALSMRIRRKSPGPLLPQHNVYSSPKQWCDSTTTDIREFRHEMVRDIPRKDHTYQPAVTAQISPPLSHLPGQPAPHIPMYPPPKTSLPPPESGTQLFPPDHLAFSMSALIKSGNIPGLSASDVEQPITSSPLLPTNNIAQSIDSRSVKLYPGPSYLGYPIRPDIAYSTGPQEPLSIAFVPGYGKPTFPGASGVSPVSSKFPPRAVSPPKTAYSLPLNEQRPVVLDLRDVSPEKYRVGNKAALITVDRRSSSGEIRRSLDQSPQKQSPVKAAFTELATVKSGLKIWDQPQRSAHNSVSNMLASSNRSGSSPNSSVAAAIRSAQSFTAPVNSNPAVNKPPLRIPISPTSKKSQPEKYTPGEESFHSERHAAPETTNAAPASKKSPKATALPSKPLCVGGVVFSDFISEVIAVIVKLSQLREGSAEYLAVMQESHEKMITPAGHYLISMCKCQLETPDQLAEKYRSAGEDILSSLRQLPEQLIFLLGNTPILDE